MSHAFSYCELHSEDTGQGLEGGLMKSMLKGAPTWIVYIAVDDVHAHSERARALGTEGLGEVGEVPGVGWFSIVRDPTGAAFGLFQRKMQE